MPPVALPLESSPFLYSSDGIALSSGSAESSGFRFWRLQASGSLRSGSGLTPLPCCLKCTGGGVCSHSCHSHSHMSLSQSVSNSQLMAVTIERLLEFFSTKNPPGRLVSFHSRAYYDTA